LWLVERERPRRKHYYRSLNLLREKYTEMRELPSAFLPSISISLPIPILEEREKILQEPITFPTEKSTERKCLRAQ